MTDLARAFDAWERATARHLRGHRFITDGVAFDGSSGHARHFNISDTQASRLAGLLAADADLVKARKEEEK